MLCRHSGVVRLCSLNSGAAVSLLWLPVNVKLGCCSLEPVVLELLLLPLIEARSRVQGTATCFSLPEEEDDEETPLPDVPLEDSPLLELLLLDGRVVEEVPDELPLVPVPELPPVAALESRSRIAKSMRPDCGLMITSLMLPMVVPCELVTLAPIRSLPFTDC